MKRLIIVDGCDRTGKTTFINKLNNKLKELNYIPFIFHLMGPNKFEGLTFNNDDKSLIQLSKFNDELDLFKVMLNSNQKVMIILDRSHFSEYVWTKYWNRTGKYTNYLLSQTFFNKHKELFNNIIYVHFFTSNINELCKRILLSDEDKKNFTDNGKSIKDNINTVYKLFSELLNIIKLHNINTIEINNSGTISDLDKKIIDLINQKVLKQE